MSAYMVNHNHVNYLVSAAVVSRDFSYWDKDQQKRVKVTRENADQVGQMLRDENLQSVASRYDGKDINPGELPGAEGGSGFQFEYVDCLHLHFKPVDIFKACACFEYQACEHEGWEQSGAHNFIESLTAHFIQRLPGYDAAKWGAPEPEYKSGQVRRVIG